MIVYGDPSYRATVSDISARLRSLIVQASCSLDSAREALVLAGMLEQAVFDCSDKLVHESLVMRLTDHLASGRFDASLLDGLESSDDLKLKVPEGFAFYTLYPENYRLSARAWAAGKEPNKVLVVGLRSIGTTLSSVVKAALVELGFDVDRLTVRPEGHPFDRHITFDPWRLKGVQWLLIVDEGPGISGSSIASVARFAIGNGFPENRIAFLPSSTKLPGPEAAAEVRRLWNGVARYPSPVFDFVSPLRRETERLCGPVFGVAHLAGGPFSRSKLRMELSDGSSVLWKFAGHTHPPDRDPFVIQQRRAHAGWAMPPLGSKLGFMATRWIEGTPLTTADTAPDLLRYIAHSEEAPMNLQEASEARERLLHMLYWNTVELEGRSAADDVIAHFSTLAIPLNMPCYGDGHLDPHEWIRSTDGRIYKTDCWGHDWDHTVVGRQPWLWDLAGAVVEWGRDVPADVDRDQLAFYVAAFRSFRAGLSTMT